MKRLLLLTGLAGCLAAALGGCEREMHNMYRQPRYDAGEASPLFADGKAARPAPPGSIAVAMGEPAATSSGRRGGEEVSARAAAAAATAPPPPTLALLHRGQERFTAYCLPCHGALGEGEGPVVLRGFPRPPSYHQPRLRAAPDRHFYDVITHGYGVMYPYADRVTPEDRWAITAYIRALQLSQHATLAALPPDLRERFAQPPRQAPSAEAAASAVPAAPLSTPSGATR